MNKNFVAICITMVLCTTLGVYGFLGVHKVDTQGFLTILGTIVGPFIGILWNNLTTRKMRVEQEVQATQIETIEKNTNGTLSKLTDDIPVQVATAVAETLAPLAEQLKGVKNADEHNH